MSVWRGKMKIKNKITYISSLCLMLGTSGCSLEKYPTTESHACTIDQTAYQMVNVFGVPIHESTPLTCVEKNEQEYFYIGSIDELVAFYQAYGIYGSQTNLLWIDFHLDMNEVARRLNEVIPARFSLSFSAKHGAVESTLEIMDSYYEEALMHAQRIADEVRNVTTDPSEQMRIVHDHLLQTITYSNQGGNDGYDEASDAFFLGLANCSGYSRAYFMVLRELEIPVLYVSSNTMDHAWNMGYDGTNYWYIDTSFDDVSKKNKDDYITTDRNYFYDQHKLDFGESDQEYVKRMQNLYHLQ